MKKILLGISLVSSIFAANNAIKTDNTFISADYGITSLQDHQKYAGVKLGTYIYSDNIYNINNRVYISAGKIFTKDNVKCYHGRASLDWIGTTTTLKPFFGVSLGYVDYKEKDTKYSFGTEGVQAGLIYYLGSSFEIEMGASWDKPLTEKKIKDPIKKVYGGLNYSF